MLVLVVVAVILFFYREQNAFSTTFYRLTTHKFHSTQGQIRIVQLSDLHSKTFGRKNKRLINKIKRLNPDLIFATGDLISSTDTNGGAFLDLIDGLKGQYPIFYIEGNHETTARYDQMNNESGWYDDFLRQLKEKGICRLDNAYQQVEVNGEELFIYGLTLPLTHYKAVPQAIKDRANHREITALSEVFSPLRLESINILLAHSPFLATLYEKHGFDYTYSGHVHGGILRLPFVGGVLSPERKFFPTYSCGIYSMNRMTLIVSRGLGKLRLFNRPHLVVVDLVADPNKPRHPNG